MIIAYIDAGTGAMLLQWIIAIIIGSSLFFRNTIVRLFGKFFRSGTSTRDAETSGDHKGDERQKDSSEPKQEGSR